MGNYYEMIGKMKVGQVITTEGQSSYRIKKTSGGSLIYVDADGNKETLFGCDGHVIAHDNMNEFQKWKIEEEYVEIGLNEVKDRLKSGLSVYIDSGKKQIDKCVKLEKHNCIDFGDVFLLVKYYKKR